MFNTVNETQFNDLVQQGFNRIPLVLETLADLETPLSLYLKLAHSQEGGRYSFLLESVVGGERFGRYSFIGLPARTLIRCSGFGDKALTCLEHDGVVVETLTGNPLQVIERIQNRYKVALPPQAPRFCGGFAGYFGYDTVRHIEPKLVQTCPPDTLNTPDILLLLCEELAVVDNLSGKLSLIVYVDPQKPNAYLEGMARLAEIKSRLTNIIDESDYYLQRKKPNDTVNSLENGVNITRNYPKEDYMRDVMRAKEWICAGDAFQLVFGQRLEQPFKASPLSLYRALRMLNPSPYMYYYHMGDHHVVGASPEILVRKEKVAQGHQVTIRPLAGTRPRGATPQQDAQLEKELLTDPKERAEHVMLIDLARNDIGRIARVGTVKVTDAFTVERYSHVLHIVSNVQGILLDNMSNMDVLRATFPAGTLSGTPKVHAMELIDQLEPVKRGIYGGACGYISFAGDMDLAIAIRTGIIKNETLYVQAGAGVVFDSDPQKEWEETEHKARALLLASEIISNIVN